MTVDFPWVFDIEASVFSDSPRHMGGQMNQLLSNVVASGRLASIVVAVLAPFALMSCNGKNPSDGGANGKGKKSLSVTPSESPETGSPSVVPSSPGEQEAQNLVISAQDRLSLRTTLLSASHMPDEAGVKGPLPNTVFYARYRGTDWAIATFSLPGTGTTDQPERFRRPVGGQWTLLGDTGSPLKDSGIPCPVLRAWNMDEGC